jgi:tetratricopeptide (TPR) repeat protein
MRLSAVLRSLVALFLFAAFAGSAAAQTTLGRISGLVLDENGKPIKAATVTAENSETNQELTATTDEKGRFTILGMRPAGWKFTAAAPGYFPDQGMATIRVGSPNSAIAFALKKTGAPGGGALGSFSAKDLQSILGAADTLFTQGRWDEAIAAYKALLERAPSLSSVNLQIAAAYVNKKDYDTALGAYGDLLKTDPGNEKAIVGLARARLERGDAAGAEDTLKKAADQSGAGAGREIFMALGDMKFDSGDTDGAISWYERATTADPSWGRAWFKRGLAAQKNGDRPHATEFLNKVLDVAPMSAEAVSAKDTLNQLNR